MPMKKMYVNKNNKLNYNDRLRIVKQFEVHRRKKSHIARLNSISRQTVDKIIKRYSEVGLYGLEDHRPGPRRLTLNPQFWDYVVQLRKTHDWGALRIEAYLKKKGFSVSKYKIHHIIRHTSSLRKKMGKREKPKYVRYEAENINDQWHIDWSIDPQTKKKLLAILDDKSRFIVYVGLFDEATAENSAIGLKTAIEKYCAPKEIVSDNGSHFKKPHSKKVVVSPLREIEEAYRIKHIFIRAYHPQSNGKIERLFGSYKIEFPRMNHPKVYDLMSWVEYYNFERLHQSLNYETPAHEYLGVNSI